MGTVLIDQWLGDATRIPVLDDASVSEVREAIRAEGLNRALPTLIVEGLAAAASELARNQLVHANGGIVGVRGVTRNGVPGIEVIAADRGAGLVDPTSALRGAPRVGGSLGVGLSAAARQSDELDLDIRRGAGTCIRLRSFARPVPRSEVGILAQPHPNEVVIGDHAAMMRDDAGLILAVADGLGHGPAAREAADRAIDEVLRRRRPIEEALALAHAALSGTRGAVMSILHVGDRIEHGGVGNVSTRVIGDRGNARHFGSAAGTLGSVFPRRVNIDREAFGVGEVLVMFTDGLTSRVDLTYEPALTRQHPIIVAHSLLGRFVRGTDDVLVAVVR